MQQVFIKFNNGKQVNDFINIIDKIVGNFRLVSDRCIVDAKSILGIFSLDLTKPQRLICDSTDEKVMDQFAPFLCRQNYYYESI